MSRSPPSSPQSTSNPMGILQRRGYSGFVRIDSGGQANVYRSSKDGKLFAIKVTKVNPRNQEKLDEDLRRELLIARNVNHPNCIHVEDMFRTKDRVYLVMDYVPNGTIDTIVSDGGPLSEWNVLVWFPQIARAIKYLHKVKVAHRDLKLDNVLLDKHLNPIVTDFGYSKLVEPDPARPGQRKLSDTFCGTAPYHSPEINKEIVYDPFKVDIWCLGVMLFVMINQDYPFRYKDGAVAMTEKQMARDYRLRPNIEENVRAELKDLIRMMLEPVPEDRPDIEKVCAHRWMPLITREEDILAQRAQQNAPNRK